VFGKKKNKTPDYVMWFRDIKKDDIPLVGGKGANLGELTRSGIPVPNGFCVTAQAYYYYLEKTGIKQEIAKLLSGQRRRQQETKCSLKRDKEKNQSNTNPGRFG
jgi:phosphoenolpyruvate synthase/pyruvate phosphate dikinase